jgi:hypothetical protein
MWLGSGRKRIHTEFWLRDLFDSGRSERSQSRKWDDSVMMNIKKINFEGRS